jgi:hypothetical protein
MGDQRGNTPVTERTELILYFSIATFLVVVFIAVLLVKRHGHSIETKRILDAVEGARNQIDVLDGTVKGDMGVIKGWLSEVRERFGFLRKLK